jgi:molybdopterin converting factor small subunit
MFLIKRLQILVDPTTKKSTVIIRLSAPLSERIGSRGEIRVQGDDIEECLKAISIKFPELGKIIWTESDQINPAILIFYKEEVIHGKELKRAVSEGDQIDIIPAISGG